MASDDRDSNDERGRAGTESGADTYVNGGRGRGGRERDASPDEPQTGLGPDATDRLSEQGQQGSRYTTGGQPIGHGSRRYGSQQPSGRRDSGRSTGRQPPAREPQETGERPQPTGESAGRGSETGRTAPTEGQPKRTRPPQEPSDERSEPRRESSGDDRADSEVEATSDLPKYGGRRDPDWERRRRRANQRERATRGYEQQFDRQRDRQRDFQRNKSGDRYRRR